MSSSKHAIMTCQEKLLSVNGSEHEPALRVFLGSTCRLSGRSKAPVEGRPSNGPVRLDNPILAAYQGVSTPFVADNARFIARLFMVCSLYGLLFMVCI